MGEIPPGPQIPFSKDRSYGQEPGFISRNVGKVMLIFEVLMAVATLLFLSAIADRNGTDSRQSSIPTPARR